MRAFRSGSARRVRVEDMTRYKMPVMTHTHTNIILGGKMICRFNTTAVETIGHSENRRPYTVFKQIRNSPITRITDVCCVRAIMRPVNTYIIYLFKIQITTVVTVRQHYVHRSAQRSGDIRRTTKI